MKEPKQQICHDHIHHQHCFFQTSPIDLNSMTNYLLKTNINYSYRVQTIFSITRNFSYRNKKSQLFDLFYLYYIWSEQILMQEIFVFLKQNINWLFQAAFCKMSSSTLTPCIKHWRGRPMFWKHEALENTPLKMNISIIKLQSHTLNIVFTSIVNYYYCS